MSKISPDIEKWLIAHSGEFDLEDLKCMLYDKKEWVELARSEVKECDLAWTINRDGKIVKGKSLQEKSRR